MATSSHWQKYWLFQFFHIFVYPSINKIVRRNYNYKITYYNFSGKSTLVKIAVKSTTIRKTSWITKKSSTKTSFPFPANTVIKDSHQVPWWEHTSKTFIQDKSVLNVVSKSATNTGSEDTWSQLTVSNKKEPYNVIFATNCSFQKLAKTDISKTII